MMTLRAYWIASSLSNRDCLYMYEIACVIMLSWCEKVTGKLAACVVDRAPRLRPA